jgi:serine/threonine-protein kinase Chk2
VSKYVWLFCTSSSTLSDLRVEDPLVSNRHCLIFTENKDGRTMAIIEDLSSNGTFVNEAIVGRNKRRELKDRDEIIVLDRARFIFRYPKTIRENNTISQKYTIRQKIGKGHFSEVFSCVEKSTGQVYAVKVFTKDPGGSTDLSSKTDSLQQEIAIFMSIDHPNILYAKDTFDERDAVYLVLELAPEGELFNLIVEKQKLTEEETRKIFLQIFQAVKYLVRFFNLVRLAMFTNPT